MNIKIIKPFEPILLTNANLLCKLACDGSKCKNTEDDVVVIDMSDVVLANSTFFAEMVRCSRRGNNVIFAGMSETVLKVYRTLKIDHIIPMVSSLSDLPG
jgi:anti-anti-sigma regulatory factor